jgi:hypothetical protein
VQADWNQNNPSAPDYVKNRPFWTSDPVDTELYNKTLTISDGFGEYPVQFNIIAGQEYTVVFDNTTYVLTGVDDGNTPVHIGSESIWQGSDYNDTEPPFAIGAGWLGVISTDGVHTIKVNGVVPNVYKIDKKYLPGKSSVYFYDIVESLGFDKNAISDFIFYDEPSGEYQATVALNRELFEQVKTQCNYSPIVLFDDGKVFNSRMNDDYVMHLHGQFFDIYASYLSFFNVFCEIAISPEDASQLYILMFKNIIKVATITE